MFNKKCICISIMAVVIALFSVIGIYADSVSKGEKLFDSVYVQTTIDMDYSLKNDLTTTNHYNYTISHDLNIFSKSPNPIYEHATADGFMGGITTSYNTDNNLGVVALSNDTSTLSLADDIQYISGAFSSTISNVYIKSNNILDHTYTYSIDEYGYSGDMANGEVWGTTYIAYSIYVSPEVVVNNDDGTVSVINEVTTVNIVIPQSLHHNTYYMNADIYNYIMTYIGDNNYTLPYAINNSGETSLIVKDITIERSFAIRNDNNSENVFVNLESVFMKPFANGSTLTSLNNVSLNSFFGGIIDVELPDLSEVGEMLSSPLGAFFATQIYRGITVGVLFIVVISVLLIMVAVKLWAGG